MITSKMFVLCDRVIIDQRVEDVTLVGVLDEVTASQNFPVSLQKSTLMLWTIRTDDVPAEVQIQITIYMGDNEIFSRQIPINYREKMKNRLMLTLDGLPIPSDGILEFKAEYDGEVIATMGLLIHPAAAVIEGDPLTEVDQN